MSTHMVSTDTVSCAAAEFVDSPHRSKIKADVTESVPVQPNLLVDDTVSLNDLDAQVLIPNAEVSEKKPVVANLIKKIGSLSGIVRVAGVSAVVLSMCLYLLDGMTVVNDTQRFFTMLMLTGLLSAGGFALAFLLKEQRGARSFFGLALLSVPVNFTVLGALVYSVFQLDSISTAYPTVAHWTVASVASLGSTALIATLALIPITIFGISIMGREGRSWLSGALLFSSSMLLLPVRDTSLITPIVAILVLALISLVKKHADGVVSLKTRAGRFVQALLFLPPALMLFRSFWLYDVSSTAAFFLALTIFVVLRYTSQRVEPDRLVCNLVHLVSSVVALVTAFLSVNLFSVFAGPHFETLIFCVVFCALMVDVENRAKNPSLTRAMGIATALVLTVNILVYQQSHDGLIVFIGGILVLTTLLGIGIAQKHKEKSAIAGIALISALLLNADGMVDFLLQAGWLGFASLGAIAIITASLLERFGAAFNMQARRWFKPIKTIETQ